MTPIHRPRLVKARFTAVALMASLSAVAIPPSSAEALAQGSGSEQMVQKGEQKMKINITIGGKLLTATLADNATAQEFVSVLPLSVSMNDLFGREKYGDVPKALSESGPRRNRYEVGDIAYWSPDHQFAIYYHQDGESIPSPGIIPIAKIDRGVEAFNVSGSVKVTIELAK
jgi:hypothetical protein